ncbi:MAG: hypothetical protein H6817_11985 [Phycisphaerales bacterium]|nr:hypothetical protein [Phycisphaerales bacterium]
MAVAAGQFRIARSYPGGDLRGSRRTVAVARLFGVDSGRERCVLPDLAVRIGPGRIVAFVGPSGSGKTTALNIIEQRHPAARNLQRMSFPGGKALVDLVAPRADLAVALELLSRCALGEAPLWLRSFETLSAGEQFRARLARALGAEAERGGGLLLIDEFSSGLHRRAAKAIAHNLRKTVTRCGISLAIATTHEDVLGDLQADTVVRLDGGGDAQIIERVPRKQPPSFARRLHIEPGSRRDYNEFARMHYRTTEELGFVSKVFVMRERPGGPCVGIVVYSHPPAELTLRNQATDGRFKGNLKLLNQEMRILRRLVIHPDLRGCGLGHRLVRRTLPLAGTPYVECLAAMGAVNPVFERAGMTRVGVCKVSKARQRVLEELRELDADPLAPDFERQVCRRPRVRTLVASQVYHWYQATTGGGEKRVERQTPQLLARIFRGLVGMQPVYFLWQRNERIAANENAT